MTPRSHSHPTSGTSQNRILFLLSGESTTVPAAEASALVRMQDGSATIDSPEERVLIASSATDPDAIASRIAFAKRVGVMAPEGRLGPDQLKDLRKGTYRVTVFDLDGKRPDSGEIVSGLAEEIGGTVSLESPDREVTVVRGAREYVAVTNPGLMTQDWAVRRPRARPFFHPAAIFPKLSRALVNLSRVSPGEVFMDPFCGTGSLLLEAHELGASAVGVDRDARMVKGALANMSKFGQEWLGVVRGEVGRLPVSRVAGIATDIPYGRASSTSGSSSGEIMERLLGTAAGVLGAGRRLVVMHPDTVGAGSREDFVVEEEHHLYIHRNLTRTISVLRRV